MQQHKTNLLHGAFFILGVCLTLLYTKKSSSSTNTISSSPDTFGSQNHSSISEPRDSVRQVSSTTINHRIHQASAEELPNLVYDILTEGDPIKRHNYLRQALEEMTPDNWQEIFNSFAEVTRDTGKEQWAEWLLCIEYTGRIAGEDAVRHHQSVTPDWNHDRNRRAVRGWAYTDPFAALQFTNELKAESPEAHRSLVQEVMKGLAHASPESAIAEIEALDSSTRHRCIDDLAFGLINSHGIERATDWMLSDHAIPENERENYANRIESLVLTQLGFSSLRADVQNHDRAISVLTRLNQKHPLEKKHFEQLLLRAEPEDRVRFFEKMSHSPELQSFAQDEDLKRELGL